MFSLHIKKTIDDGKLGNIPIVKLVVGDPTRIITDQFQAIILDVGGLRGGIAAIYADADDRHRHAVAVAAGIAVVLGDIGFNVRRGSIAGAAPIRPKVQQNDAALIIIKRERLASGQ